jgi:hypothetical protein
MGRLGELYVRLLDIFVNSAFRDDASDPIPARAPRAMISPINAYSIRSWPESSRCRFRKIEIIDFVSS